MCVIARNPLESGSDNCWLLSWHCGRGSRITLVDDGERAQNLVGFKNRIVGAKNATRLPALLPKAGGDPKRIRQRCVRGNRRQAIAELQLGK